MSSDDQIPLFPRRALIEYPREHETADALGSVDADDGQRYFVKGDTSDAPVRASEWVGTQIAEAVGVSAPAPAQILMLDGSIAFGSRSTAGVADMSVTTSFLLDPTQLNLGTPPSVGLRSVLSAAYTVDMFLWNSDRNIQNYLSTNDAGTRRLLTFDYGTCLFQYWPLKGFPPAGSATRRFGKILRGLHGFDEVVAKGTLDRLSALNVATVQGFVNQMPSDWLKATIRAEFIAWWQASPRQERIEELRKGLSDGTLL